MKAIGKPGVRDLLSYMRLLFVGRLFRRASATALQILDMVIAAQTSWAQDVLSDFEWMREHQDPMLKQLPEKWQEWVDHTYK